MNEFNITNKLWFFEIESDYEIIALILLASLLNNWEAMRMVVSNLANKIKLSYDDIHDMIIAEKVHKKDLRVFWYLYGLKC